MTLQTLSNLFADLARPPKSTKGSSELSAIAIPGLGGHHVARDSVDRAVLLIKTSSQVKSLPPPVRLENLAIDHDVYCRIWQGNTIIQEDHFTVLACLSSDIEIKNHFLNVAIPFLAYLGPSPQSDHVAHLLGVLTELFRALSQPPRKSIQGLWGELFLISRAVDVETLITCWHSDPNERYDFSSGNQRIEVKCALGATRRHHFSLEQVSPPVGARVIVASICTERIGGGTSVGDLLSTIRSALSGNSRLLLRLESVVAATCGQSLGRALTDSFDIEIALDTLRFYNIETVPKPKGEIPLEVSDVRFRSDLSSQESIGMAFLEGQKLFQAVLSK